MGWVGAGWLGSLASYGVQPRSYVFKWTISRGRMQILVAFLTQMPILMGMETNTANKTLWFRCGTDSAHRISQTDALRLGLLTMPRGPKPLTARQAVAKRWRIDYMTGAVLP